MSAFGYIVGSLPTLLLVWVLILLSKKRLIRRFPLFFGCTVFLVLADLARLLFVGRSIYFQAYWLTQACSVLLATFALYESFRSIFGAYRRFLWARLLWPATIMIIWLWSGWRAWIHPPGHVSPSGAVLISAVILSSYTIVGSVLLFFLLVKLIITRWYPYEFHIVYGLGLWFTGMAAAAVVRSEFGKRFAWFTEWGPLVAYLIAAVVWVAGFLRAEPVSEVNMPVEEILQEMQEDLSIMKRIRKALMPGKR